MRLWTFIVYQNCITLSCLWAGWWRKGEAGVGTMIDGEMNREGILNHNQVIDTLYLYYSIVLKWYLFEYFQCWKCSNADLQSQALKKKSPVEMITPPQPLPLWRTIMVLAVTQLPTILLIWYYVLWYIMKYVLMIQNAFKKETGIRCLVYLLPGNNFFFTINFVSLR